MKIGLNLFSLRNYTKTREDFLKLTETLKTDYDFLQFSGSPLSLAVAKEVSEESGLPIVVTHSPYDRILNDTDKLMEEHLAMGCKYIGLGMLPGMGDAGDEEILEKLAKLNEVGKYMQEHGCVFCYHNHFQEFRKLADGRTIMDYMIEELPYIHFIPDTYWIQFAGANILEYFEKMAGRMECVHLKDYRVVPAERKSMITYLGDGAINFRAVIEKANACGAEYFLVEQDTAADLPDGLEQVMKSAKYIKENF